MSALLLGVVVPAALLTGCGGGGGGSSRPRPTATATVTPTGSATATASPTGTTPVPQNVPSFAFVSTRDGNPEIYLAQNNAQTQIRLTNDAGVDSAPSLSPDGRSVVFSSTRDGNAEIYFFSTVGPEPRLRRLTEDGPLFAPSDTDPVFSPDGRTIAWISTRGDDVRPNIWLMDVTGANQRQLINDTELGASAPAWTANGNQIGFVHTGASGTDVRLANVSNGSISSPLSLIPGTISNLSFDPTSNNFVYDVSQDPNTSRLFISNLNTGASSEGPSAGQGFFNDVSPTWSQNGNVIAFNSPSASGAPRQIYAAAPAGNATARQLTTQGENYSPSFQAG